VSGLRSAAGSTVISSRVGLLVADPGQPLGLTKNDGLFGKDLQNKIV